MRKFLVSAALIGLMAGVSPALAQDREHKDQGGAAPAEQRGGGQPHGGPAPRAQPHGAPAARPAAQAQPQRGGPPRGQETRGPQQARPAANNAMRGNPRPANAPANAMRGPGGAGRDFSSARNYHQNFNASRRFHAAGYQRPQGYYDHHWGWGETLPSFFWARQYWLMDFGMYGLPPPPFGAVWVRVNDDALLIDQTSGMIIEVDYGVFY
ncbi:MAG TPA: RcnB family protein [Rhizomicrobium sp.]|nr:RcnB family protein [Rhizomicrobium sp.]